MTFTLLLLLILFVNLEVVMNDLSNVEYLSRILDNWSASSGQLRPAKSDRSNTLQEIYYPVTLGNMTEVSILMFNYTSLETKF